MEKTLNINRIENIIFMGTSDFAVPVFLKLVNSKNKPKLLITQPDRRSGRKKNKTPELIKIANERNIPVYQPEDVNVNESIDYISLFKPDLIVTASYGAILKKRVRHIAKFGCYNIHPSLLPKYRGATPVNAPLLNGDTKTGVTIFLMKAKMDTGPILIQEEFDIDENDCYTILQLKLAEISGDLLQRAIDMLKKGTFHLVQQNHSIATYTKKITKEDVIINWDNTAEELIRKIRAYAVNPGLKAKVKDKEVKILSAYKGDKFSDAKSGTIVNVVKNIGFEVVSGFNETIIITEVQPAGKKVMNCYEFNLGARLKIGDRFDS